MTGRGNRAGIVSPGCRVAVGVALPRAGGELPLRGDIVGLVANCPEVPRRRWRRSTPGWWRAAPSGRHHRAGDELPLRGDIIGPVANFPGVPLRRWRRSAPGWWRIAPSGRHRRAGGELPRGAAPPLASLYPGLVENCPFGATSSGWR